jgi:BASS family bile acid:Na+ symporter
MDLAATSSVEDSILVTAVLPAALALIMFVLGTSLTVADFKRVFVLPRGVAIGMANLLFVSPLLAFAIAELYGLDPILAVGLVLLGASPGGTMANILTHFARGDTALSVTMTALSSVVSVITVPIYLALATSFFDAGELGNVEMTGVVARVFAITIVPISLGMWVRSRRTEWVEAKTKTMRVVSFAVFVAVVVAAVASEWDTVADNLTAVGAAALTLNVAAMSFSFTAAKLVRLTDRQATAIAMELGVHNSTLAITVGATLAEGVSTPAAVYSAFMFLTAGALARVMYKRIGPEADDADAKLAEAPA